MTWTRPKSKYVEFFFGKVNVKLLKVAACIAIFLAASVVGYSAARTFTFIKKAFSSSEATIESIESQLIFTQEFKSILPPATVPLGDEHGFDPTGYYEIRQETLSGSFAGFESFDLATREYSNENGSYWNKPIIPRGTVFAGKEFPLQKIAVSGREISFETETVGGVSYKFIGHFPVAALPACENCEYPPDLKGTLTKTKAGKVVESGEVEFYVSGC